MTPPPSYKLSQGVTTNTSFTPTHYVPSIPITSYFSPTSPPPSQAVEDDSGFESLVTNASDSGSLSSRLVALSPANLDQPSPYLNRFSDPPYQNLSKNYYQDFPPTGPGHHSLLNNPQVNGQS